MQGKYEPSTAEFQCWAIEDINPPHAILCSSTKPMLPELFHCKSAAQEECDETHRPYRVNVLVTNV